MKIKYLLILLSFLSCTNGNIGIGSNVTNNGTINEKTADHTVVSEIHHGKIPEADIQTAIENLHIAYGHTSHGSQLTTGMDGLVSFANGGNLGGTDYSNNLFGYSSDGSNGLHLFEGDGYSNGSMDHDAGYFCSETEWVSTHASNWYLETKEFLDNPDNNEYNVIIWSWCGQLSDYSKDDLQNNYLNPMTMLEKDYPEVTFVYMTGHLDGTGEEGNLNQNNEIIRQHCIDNNRWLYDFADIESHDPDGNYYLDKAANDACNYDSNGDGSRDSNWASEWQDLHIEGTDWFSCSSAHSEALNANMKAYAAWWLWVQIAK